jgi:hypothetical protein
MVKKTDIIAAHRFFLLRQGANVPVITDVVERGDGTVWVVSPLGGMGRSTLPFTDMVLAVEIIEGDKVVKSERLV